MRIFLMLMTMTFLACTASTPAGTVLLTKDLEAAVGPKITHRSTVTLGDTAPTSVEFEIHSALSEGANHITQLTATVVDAGGWEVQFVSMGEPINLGTHDAPSMSLPVLIQRSRNNACGTQSAQHLIHISAEGTASVQAPE